MEEPRARTAQQELSQPPEETVATLSVPRRSGLSRGVVATGLAAACLLAFGAWSAVQWRQAVSDREEGRAAVEAASAEVTALTSVSARTRDADVEKLLDGATAEFRDEFEEQTDAFREALASSKVRSTGEVVSAGLVRLDGDRASVLVAASGTVTNSQARRPEPRNYRLAVDLQKEDGRWLVSGLEFVG